MCTGNRCGTAALFPSWLVQWGEVPQMTTEMATHQIAFVLCTARSCYLRVCRKGFATLVAQDADARTRKGR